jgi:23S rRNA (uracil1939-C5)-methyltransferase
MRPFRKNPESKAFSPNPNIWRRSHQSRFSGTKTEVCGIKIECGSCSFINESYQDSLLTKLKSAEEVLRTNGLLEQASLLPVVASPVTLGYRTHAKLAVRPAPPTYSYRSDEEPAARFSIGLYKPGTHQVVPLDRCPVHRHTINDVLGDLKAELEASTIEPYHEGKNTGDLRYLAIRVSHLTSEVMISFVLTREMKAEIRNIVNALRHRGHHIVAAYMNINTDTGNAIFSDKNLLAAGSERLRERLCDVQLELGPTSFMQVNPWQADQIYRRIESLAGSVGDSRPVAWDLYCGIGPISLMMSRLGYKVFGIEENPQAIADARHNAARNREISAPEFMAGRVEDVGALGPEWARNPALIVANPSRRGIAESARTLIRETMLANRKCKFIYMSCEAETMARDLKDIVGDSALKIRQIEPFDMFPFTEKLEWLTVVTH